MSQLTTAPTRGATTTVAASPEERDLRRYRNRFVAGLVAALVVAVALPSPARAEGDHAHGDPSEEGAPIPGGDYQQLVDITFPTRPDAGFHDGYHDPRSGGARIHKAVDLMGEKMWPLYAAAQGEVCHITGYLEPEPSWGMSLTICGEDGRRFRYIHINNDTPGTDDGTAQIEHAYAPGIRPGTKVARGQLVAYMGDSGNAEGTAPHLHFEILDKSVTDPYGDNRINPYPSLLAALARGDIPDGTAVYLEPVERVAGDDRIQTAIALAEQRFDQAPTVILAPAELPAEAIVAGPLARALDVPVLVTWSDRLDPALADALVRFGTEEVVLVGNGLSDQVVAGLAELGIADEALDRVPGQDRYEVAAAVAERVWATDDSSVGRAPSQGVVEGEPVPAEVLDPPAEGSPDEGEPADTDAPTGTDPAEEVTGPVLPVLAVSARAGRGEPVALEGATVSGKVAVFLTPPAGEVEAVRFWVHQPGEEPEGEPDQVERRAPYDLFGTRDGDGPANRWDTREVGNGELAITAEVVGGDEDTTTVTATFTVRNLGPRRALIALGEHPDPGRSWPDALMASWYGSVTRTPVLLVTPDGLPEATVAALDGVVKAVIVGGPAAIGEDVAAEIAELVDHVRRLHGETRYSTATSLADDLDQREVTKVWVATGMNWPDAVTAGPAVAAAGDTLVLVDGPGAGGDAETAAWLHRRADRIDEGVIIGGHAAVSPEAQALFSRRIT